jgi:hypothetical protein
MDTAKSRALWFALIVLAVLAWNIIGPHFF